MKYWVLALALFATPAALANTGHNGDGSNNANIGDEQVELDRGDNNGTINAYNGTVNRTENTTTTNIDRSRTDNRTINNNSVRDNSVNNDATGGDATGGAGGSATATGGAGGSSTATGGEGGKGGKAKSNASATGGSVGDTTSSSNNVNTNDSVATVGNTTSSSDNTNSNDSEGGDVEFNYSYESTTADNAASSAASVLTGFCQTGGSAQGFNGGFTLTGNDQFCDRIRMADYYWVQYERQVELAKAFACNQPISALESRCAKIGERMISAIDKAWENTEEANSLLDSGQFASHVEKATGPFARIGGILALLVLL